MARLWRLIATLARGIATLEVMAHNCPNSTPAHSANSKCVCTRMGCLIGARKDLADDLEALGKTFDQKLRTLQEEYEQALRKLR